MKTRIIHTRIWEDEWFCNLSNDAQKLFLYLITNQRINICGIYRISDRIIYFDTKIRLDRLERVKNELEDSGKVAFFDGWVYVKNAKRLGGYKGDKNEVASNRELDEVPDYIKKCLFKGICDRVSENRDSVGSEEDKVSAKADTSINHKSETINHKSEDILRAKTEKFIRQLKDTIGDQSLLKEQVEELKKFVSYWTEPNKSQTKIRWELEKTWDTARRLNTWFSRSKNFQGKEKNLKFTKIS